MIPLNLFVSTKSLDALSFQSLFLGCLLRILPHQNLTPRNYLLPGASSSLLLFTPFLSTFLYNPPISTDLFISLLLPTLRPSIHLKSPPPLPFNLFAPRKTNLSQRLLLQSLFSIILFNFLKGYQSLEIFSSQFSATQSLCTNVPLVLSFLGPSLPPRQDQALRFTNLPLSTPPSKDIRIPSALILQVRGALIEVICRKGSVEK
jgi:hypothetical protein